jgi:cell wall assembly regulator SMI1
MGEVERLWERLEAWAQREAPSMLALLRGPASEADLASLERAIGVTLPADLRASLRVHDGETQDDYLRVWRGAGHLLTAAEILESWSNCRGFAEEPDAEAAAEQVTEGIISVEGPVHAVAFREGWIPFMDMNGDTTWFVDLDPAPGGRHGQVIEVYLEGCQWKVLAPSYEAFLRAYVEALEAGEFAARDPAGLPARPDDPDAGEPGEGEPGSETEYMRAARAFAELEGGKRKKKPNLSAAQFRRLDRLLRTVTWQKLVKLRTGTRKEVVGIVHASIGDLHQILVTGGMFFARGPVEPGREPMRVFRLALEIGAGGAGAVHTILRAERLDLDRD